LVKSSKYITKKTEVIIKHLKSVFSKEVPTLFEIIEKKETIASKIIPEKWISEITNVINMTNKIAKNNGYNDFNSVDDKNLQDLIVKTVAFCLTNGCISSKYNYGLMEKMFTTGYNYHEEFKWILNDIAMDTKSTKLISNPCGFYNICYIDQVDYSGVHRSGWQYVYDNIKRFHNDSGIVLDLYVDRTFHWNSEINRNIGIIPYKKPWVGFVHHTFDTSFSEYNCCRLLESDDFIQSLDVCKGLVVLSKYLKKQLQSELRKKGINDIPIFVMMHPTSTDVIKWHWSKFKKNNDKKIVHIGGWLRDIYSFYSLNIDRSCQPALRKVALRGKEMSNYFPPESFCEDLYNCISKKTHYSSIQNISVGSLNTWCNFFYNDIIKLIESVDIIEYLQNSEYDELLSQNIVFIRLIDASAVNTVVECVVRCTPIIVNKHPAVVEILGENYPLYIDDNDDINRLTSYDKIRKAHIYLKSLKIPNIRVDYFVKELNHIISSL
jgi:hypothetical protein